MLDGAATTGENTAGNGDLGPALSTIILLNREENAKKIVPVLYKHNPSIRIIVTETLDALEALPASELATARLLSVGGTVIVPGHILSALGFSAYNFHPGPPLYPGWAPFNFALYEHVLSYGTTVHQMVEKVDAGPIIGLDFFVVPPRTGIRDLIDLTKSSLARQLEVFAAAIVTRREPFPILPIPWAAKATTKKQFAKLCELTGDLSPAEFRRRINAFGNGDGHSLPNISRDGIRFVLASDQNAKDDEKSGLTLYLHGVRFSQVP